MVSDSIDIRYAQFKSALDRGDYARASDQLHADPIFLNASDASSTATFTLQSFTGHRHLDAYAWLLDQGADLHYNLDRVARSPLSILLSMGLDVLNVDLIVQRRGLDALRADKDLGIDETGSRFRVRNALHNLIVVGNPDMLAHVLHRYPELSLDHPDPAIGDPPDESGPERWLRMAVRMRGLSSEPGRHSVINIMASFVAALKAKQVLRDLAPARQSAGVSL